MSKHTDITFNVDSLTTMDNKTFVKQLSYLIARNISPLVNILPPDVPVSNVANLYIMHSTSKTDNFEMGDFKVETLGTLKPYAVFENPAGLRISCRVPNDLLPIDHYAGKVIKVLLIDTDSEVNILGLFLET